MEFIPPLTWELLESDGRPHPFRLFQDPSKNRKLIIADNDFMEKFLPEGVVRFLTEQEMEQYRAPFLEPSSREPIYRWPNEAPLEGKPTEVQAIIKAYHDWLIEPDIPQLSFYGSPGAIIKRKQADYYRKALINTKSVDIGPGRHWLVEDNPHLIGSEMT